MTTTHTAVAELMKRLVAKLAANPGFELFLHESRANGYQPQPPEGWTALRSNKRRVFLKDGTDLKPSTWVEGLNCRSLPLSPATK